ncbi:MAG: 50S ribosomal protein L13 [Dehalococcoidales bacterium]|nr:50S ribosomal protein L13 [Dehalococcoidales bacterium]
MMKTFSAKPADIKREWHVIDASGQTLGKLTTHVAELLMGKHKPIYTPNQDTGDFVVITNAEKIHTTGSKGSKKIYYRYSGYPSGLHQQTLDEVLAKHPERVIEHAVEGMLPRNRLGARMIKKLHVYAGDVPANLTHIKKPAEKAE